MVRPACVRLRSLVMVAALAALPGGASGLSLTSLQLQNDSTADFSQGGDFMEEGSTDLSVVSQAGTSFTTRLAAQSAADKETGAAGFAESIVDVDYTLTFSVDASVGQDWTLLIDTTRLGALTTVDDTTNEGNDFALAQAGAVTGSVGGGTLDQGTLALDAANLAANTVDSNVAVDQSSFATVTGTGAAVVTLGFDFQLLTQSFVTSSFGTGNEGAVRLGLPSGLSGFAAGAYPGVGGRTAGDDGHFVSVQVIPEPSTALLLGIGLAGLALRRR